MQFSRQPAWGFRRGATAAATFGLTVMLAVSAAPAGADTARPEAVSPSVPCASADPLHSPMGTLANQDDCPSSPVASVSGGSDGVPPVRATFESDDEGEGSGQSQRIRRRPASPAPARGFLCGPPFVKGNPLLGPVFLPRKGLIGSLLFNYIRYGGLTPEQFLAKYRSATGWIFPPDDGFARNSLGQLLRFRVTLFPKQYIDRFGNEFGRFLGAGGTWFIERSLPPDSLNTPADDPAHICNYHLYRVLKSFDVDGGPAAPWFEQPGGGLQYAINPAYLPAGATAPFIPWLVDNGYLQRVV
ncbi:TNT domain-containing protein [Actinoallomurus rhizosphaericola]|uniref:TNT domain-containing protein n=1 Tax=Actinoallomurus rhizosphaericola TaxID=2952536 RepID=UPI002093301D|nr:TNT domain-containing protein [Actinoallomurus rhizosphaericola]MCO5996383.1 TNT domain-containing protein [Actinoallomurus rhizosphaericola]